MFNAQKNADLFRITYGISTFVPDFNLKTIHHLQGISCPHLHSLGGKSSNDILISTTNNFPIFQVFFATIRISMTIDIMNNLRPSSISNVAATLAAFLASQRQYLGQWTFLQCKTPNSIDVNGFTSTMNWHQLAYNAICLGIRKSICTSCRLLFTFPMRWYSAIRRWVPLNVALHKCLRQCKCYEVESFWEWSKDGSLAFSTQPTPILFFAWLPAGEGMVPYMKANNMKYC